MTDGALVQQWFQAAVAAAAAGKHDAAVEGFGRVVRAQPNHWEAWARMALSHQARRNWASARDAFFKAVALNPQSAPLLCNLGMVHLHLRAFGDALGCFDQALALTASIPEVFNGRGVALKALNRLDEARAAFRKALELRSTQADWWCNLGNTETALHRFNEAHAAYEQALKITPGYPDALFGKSLAFLLTGRLPEGFALYEKRWESEMVGCKRIFKEPEWDGEAPLAGKTILVHNEQGLGDTIQFVRYIPQLTARGGRVILEVQPSLVGLCRSIQAPVTVVEEKATSGGFDYTCSLLSLPRLLRTTLATIPAQKSYLCPDTGAIERWQARLAPAHRPRVGIVSSGNRHHVNDFNRSLPLALLAGLFEQPAISWFLLQKDIGETDRDFLRNHPQLTHLGAEFVDFSDTAAALLHLDLVVSVDTSLAHLAGALGKPVWLLLPFSPDWRWLIGRNDSPWYPTMHLFRQARPGDWDSALAAMADAFEKLRSASTLPFAEKS